MSEHTYDFRAIEAKWQRHWDQAGTFAAPGPGDEGFDARRPKFYVLDMFPYPSGVGLHVGHPLGFIATDIFARYRRMRGYNVLHTMGFDAFGLPAEQYAVQHGVHPRVSTQQNIDNMTRQLKGLGLAHDWNRSVATTDTAYYRWTQWIFSQLFNSYFNTAQQRARPIADLVKRLESGEVDVGPGGQLIEVGVSGAMDTLGGPPIGARKWHELSAAEQQAILAEHRLAYIDEVPVNWCPGLGTVLANEEVTNEGRSEVGNHPVYKRPLKQWMMRITAYAERLAADLDLVDWPESIKLMQRNWIGRSEGAMVDFAIETDGRDDFSHPDTIRVFTTRPDTLFGATYMVLAPENPLVDQVTTDEQRSAVDQYCRQAAARSDVERMVEAKQKTGVFTGGYAINPTNRKQIPIWIADYVFMGYGTGAIMAVPAHDQRDHDFARAFDLPITQVIQPPDDVNVDIRDEAYEGDGVNVNSAHEYISIDGLPTPEAKQKITDWLETEDLGRFDVQYKLRDWVFSRQHYWGEPFPIVHSPDGQVVVLEDDELPVELPEMEHFEPEASDDPEAAPNAPLSRAPEDWRFVERNGVRYQREYNTMPQWAGSCWYYLRYIDPTNDQRFVDDEKEHYWMAPNPLNEAGGVDLYVGGVEHAVLHLLYSRFWHKALYDLGHVSTPEPFGRLFNQGYIQAYCYRDERGIAVPAEQVTSAEGKPAAEVQGQAGEQFFYNDQPVTEEYGKMGKSLKNAVAPDDICQQFGCDTLRLYEMYMGPLDASKPWATRDIIGVHRFLQRVWRNFIDDQTGALRITLEDPDESLVRLTHRTVKRVTDDIERLSFNTAIAALIEMNNALVSVEEIPKQVAETFVQLLAPMAPHLCEELWHRLGHTDVIAYEPWPMWDEQYLLEEEIEMVVQVMGKVRSRITVAADADDQTIESAALADEKIAPLIEGKTVRKVIIVPNKLVNIVAN